MEEAVKEAVLKEKNKLSKEISESLKAEQYSAIKKLQNDLDKKSKEVSDFNEKLIEIEQLKRDKAEVVSKAKLAAERQLTLKMKEAKERWDEEHEEQKRIAANEIVKKVREDNELRIKALEKKTGGSKKFN